MAVVAAVSDSLPAGDEGGTRERILDVALELFSEQGYDKASLREIAERLGISKAALYYHFASKADILLALHLRLHAIGRDLFGRMRDEPGIEIWITVLHELIDAAMVNRPLFVLHHRNQAAMEALHQKSHEDEHSGMEAMINAMLTDRSLPVSVRVRVGCAIGGVMGALVMSGDAFADVPSEDFRDILRGIVDDLLQPGRATTGEGR